MKTAITSALAFALFAIFGAMVLAVAAYRALRGQPSPFAEDEQ